MPTDFRPLGTIDHWIRPVTSSQFIHLGTAVTSPSIREGDNYIPIFNDIGGRSVETQTIRDRRKSHLITTINNINWSAYSLLKRMRGSGGALGAIGAVIAGNNGSYVETPTDHGLPVLGFSDFDLLFTFAFPSAGVDRAGDTPKGRLYYGAKLKDWGEDSAQTRLVDLTLHFEAVGRLDPATRTFIGYTEDSSAWGTLS